MKRLLFIAVVSLMVLSCNNEEKKEAAEPSNKNADMKATYEKNVSIIKSAVAAFEREDLEGWAASVADSCHWDSPAYGDTVATKAHWKESLKFFMDNWDNFKLNNAMYLPGVDSLTHEMDGGVRFYGWWDGTHKSGVKTHTSFYGTYDLNKDGKITSASEFFDLGGMMNAVMPKAAPAAK